MYTHSQLIILNLLYNYSYIILFPLVVIEGPIVTVIAGFLVSIGFMSFTPAYMTIVVGDLTGALLYYSVWCWWFKSFIYQFLTFLKIDFGNVQKLKTVLSILKGNVLFLGNMCHSNGDLSL